MLHLRLSTTGEITAAVTTPVFTDVSGDEAGNDATVDVGYAKAGFRYGYSGYANRCPKSC